MLYLLVVALLVVLLPPPALAQEDSGRLHPSQSSHYLPLGHWAYPYLDLMIARGSLPDLQPLVRPYRRADIAAAIVKAEQDNELPASELTWIDLIKKELPGELEMVGAEKPATYLRGRGTAGARSVWSTHRDVLRPNDTNETFMLLEGDIAADFPNVTTAIRFRWDDWLLNDPQFEDGRVVEHHPNFLGLGDFGGRADDSYFELQIPYFRFMFGRMARNWGLSQAQGLLVSDYSYSYDQLAYRIGTDRLSVTGFSVQLDEWDDSVKRWHSAHRVDWRVNDRVSLAISEAVVYGGENRSFDWRQATPIGIWLVGGYGKDYETGPNRNNSFSQFEAWWKPGRGTVLYGSFMYDDAGNDDSPPAYGLAVGLQFPYLASNLSLKLDYSQVAAFTYRTSTHYEIYAFRGLGIGRDMSDHDRLDVVLDWIPHPRLFLKPYTTALRRGEGDLRDPWPEGGNGGMPSLFLGQRETTLRLALGGHWTWDWIRAEFDLGGNQVWDHEHVAGETRTEFVGRILLVVTGAAWGKL
jgi:hypothetical protein